MEKVLVWVAISPKGMSQIYFRASGLAVNQDVYLNDYIVVISSNQQTNYNSIITNPSLNFTFHNYYFIFF